MPRPKTAFPKYRLHRTTGRAVVTLDGRDYYLGSHGTDESRAAYERLLIEWKQGRLGLPRQDATGAPISIIGMVAAYWRYIHAQGRYTKDGRPTQERTCVAIALRPLVRMFGDRPAVEFGPLDLQTVRDALAKPAERKQKPPKEGARKWVPRKRKEPPKDKLARTTVNGHVHRIRRVFRWAVASQLVPPAVWEALRAVEGLRRGQSPIVTEPRPVRPILEQAMLAVMPHLSRHVAAMVQLQWWTGMRPGEVVRMRTGDIDRSSAVWVYTPASHKTEHHDRKRLVPLGPHAQQILGPFLQADPGTYLFNPNHELRERIRTLAENRKTHLWESHRLRRREVLVVKLNDCWRVDSYRTAVARACVKAGVERWSPNQLRHSAATRYRKHGGLDAARVILGHNSPAITEVYAEIDRERAVQVALEVG